MAFSDFVNLRKAEWEHEDRLASLRETQRANRASEGIKTYESETNRKKYNLEAAKEYFQEMYAVPETLRIQEKTGQSRVEAAKITSESNQLISGNRISADLAINEAANANRLAVAGVSYQSASNVARISSAAAQSVAKINTEAQMKMNSAKILSDVTIAEANRTNAYNIASNQMITQREITRMQIDQKQRELNERALHNRVTETIQGAGVAVDAVDALVPG